MRFPLTPEQEAIRARARALADHEFRERAARWDEREEYPWDNVKQPRRGGAHGHDRARGLRRTGPGRSSTWSW